MKKVQSTELCTAEGKLEVNCSLLVHYFWLPQKHAVLLPTVNIKTSRYLLLIYYINNM